LNFSGGIPETINMKDYAKDDDNEELFHILDNAQKNLAFMGCSLTVCN